jgi:hypothetical protein
MPHTTATVGPEDGPPLLPRARRVLAVTPDDLPVPTLPRPPPAIAARRRATLAALFGLAAVGESANAQMGGPGGGGGGGGRGGRGQQQEGTRPDKEARDVHEAPPPRDLLSAFAMRLREGVPELALAPPQQGAWRDFVATLVEVGQHNERRLQRILFHSAGNVSAVAPLKSYIAAEVDEGEGRQEALSELKLAHDKLEAQLDARQRGVLVSLFVATRSELQAPTER